MKITRCLLPIFMICIFLFCGCTGSVKSEIEEVIRGELDLLQDLDSDSAMKYISYNELFPNVESGELSDRVKEVYSLFFESFNYKILDISVNKKEKTAVSGLRITTIDTKALSIDFASSYLRQQITKASTADSGAVEEVDDLSGRYLLLHELLTDNKYDTVDIEGTIELKETENGWEIQHSYSLEDFLVGGLMTHLSDPDILSPKDTLAIYLEAVKTVDLSKMSEFLGLDTPFAGSDPDKHAIATELTEQIHNTFDFEIVSQETNGYTASVKTNITTFDSDTILREYHKELDRYLETIDAVESGAEQRYKKSLAYLLTAIQNNTATKASSVTFHLINDGVSWKLLDNSIELGNAVLGTLTSSPLNENTGNDTSHNQDDYSSDNAYYNNY
ncbi:MAG: hypothetical protein HUJ72_02760 [Blautia sp.]|nr:hypothetical protein [Blautia sp.]